MESLFNPKNMSEGGGLVDDIEATIKEISLMPFDYNGKGNPAFCIRAILAEDDGTEHEQYFSLGKAGDWTSEDGETAIPVGRQTTLNMNSNGGILIASMVNAGFPEAKITEKITCFKGLKAHFIRVPAPERKGLVKTPRADGKVFEQTLLTVDRIIALPGEKVKAAAGKGPAPGKSVAGAKGPAPKAAAPAAEAEGEVSDAQTEATNAMMEILAENPDGIMKAQIPAKIFPKVKDSSNRNAILPLVFTDSFLQSGPWTYEGGKVTLG